MMMLHAAMDPSLQDWTTTDIMVKINETHDNTELIHQTGVIRSISVRHSFVFTLRLFFPCFLSDVFFFNLVRVAH
jgi:hypothetical protein